MGIKKKKEESVAIILPCAGHGTRLNAPYPKELTKINEDMSIIDYSFKHILASHVKPLVIVIIGPHKFDTVRYLHEKYDDKVDLVFVFQKINYNGITGAIRSAEHLLGDKNILLLPNTIIEYEDKKTPMLDRMLNALDEQPFVFLYKDESSKVRLKESGALRIEGGEVIDYEDKPQIRVEKYNAFWTAYGFKKEVFNEIISVFEQSFRKKASSRNAFRKSVMYKSHPIKANECIDISTLTNLNAHLLRQYLITSGVDPQFLEMHSK